jgi:glycosyltransferase 2 family protein
LVYYVMLLSIAPNAPLWWAGFGDAVLAMGVAVPSAPAALGVFEGSLAGALSLVGVSFSLALGYAILMHFIQFVITGILGLWGLARDGRSFSSLFRDLQRPLQPEVGPAGEDLQVES